MRDPYDVLGISQGATPDEIRSAFRKLAAKHHPDHNPGDQGAQERFKEINGAYQVLNDPQKRAMYDRFGDAGVSAGGVSGYPGSPFDISGFADIGLDGVFGDLLGAFGIGGKGDRGDIKKEMTISFREAIFGCEKELSYDRVEVCSDCHGSGSAPGASMSTCGSCNGRGKVRMQQGFLPLAVERSCSRCKGTGRIVTVPCPSCSGDGLMHNKKTVVVQIPAGIENNATHVVDRGGHVTRPSRSAGDLEISVRVTPHELFKRTGDDLVCSVPVSFPQASLGAEVEVPTLEGKGKLRVPAGTQSGSVLRIRGKGVPRRVVGGRGDQLVEIIVEVPSRLSDRARQLVEELSKELGTEYQPQRRTFMEKLRDLFG